jgi:phosphatidate cytidylyltransferase
VVNAREREAVRSAELGDRTGKHAGRHRAQSDADAPVDLLKRPTEVEARGRHYAPEESSDLGLAAAGVKAVAPPEAPPPGAGEVPVAAPADAAPPGALPVATPPDGAPSPPTPVPAPAGAVTTEPAAASRAGRNLPAAIGISVVLAGAVVASLLLYRPSFVVLVVGAVAYGSYELVVAIRTVEARPPLVPLLVGGAAMCVAAWLRGPNGLVVGFFVTAVGVLVWRLAEGAAGYLQDIGASLFVASYVPLLAGFAVLLAHPHDGAGRVMAFIATVVCSDTGGYATGVLFGRHPLAPTVSKGKTWEGLVGSVLACLICGSLLMTLTFHRPWWQGALFGLGIVAAATLGDLGESMIKRDLGVKDMGRLLPGHGGLMDRLDSLLPCAAVAYLLFSAFLDH